MPIGSPQCFWVSSRHGARDLSKGDTGAKAERNHPVAKDKSQSVFLFRPMDLNLLHKTLHLWSENWCLGWISSLLFDARPSSASIRTRR
jgi:hypothetical protein